MVPSMIWVDVEIDVQYRTPACAGQERSGVNAFADQEELTRLGSNILPLAERGKAPWWLGMKFG